MFNPRGTAKLPRPAFSSKLGCKICKLTRKASSFPLLIGFSRLQITCIVTRKVSEMCGSSLLVLHRKFCVNLPQLKCANVVLSRQAAYASAHLQLEQRCKNLGRSQLSFQLFEKFVNLQGLVGAQCLAARLTLLAAAPGQAIRDAVDSDLDSVRASRSSSSRTCEGRSSHTSSHDPTSLAPCFISVLGVQEFLEVTLPGTA